MITVGWPVSRRSLSETYLFWVSDSEIMLMKSFKHCVMKMSFALGFVAEKKEAFSFYTSFSDLDQISRSPGCQKGETYWQLYSLCHFLCNQVQALCSSEMHGQDQAKGVFTTSVYRATIDAFLDLAESGDYLSELSGRVQTFL